MGLFWSCGGEFGVPLEVCEYLGEPLELHKGSQAPFRASRGNMGLLLRPCRGEELYLTLRGGISWCFSICGGKLWVPLICHRDHSESPMLPQEVRSAFEFQGELGIPLESLPENMTSSLVKAGN